MGSKRPHSEVDTGAGSRPHDGPGDRSYPRKKHKKITSQPIGKDGAFNGVKKRARTIERRLKHEAGSMPSTVQNELERELGALRHRISDHDDKKLRNDMIKKYHMVRFFERKKAQRLEKQLRRKLEQATDSDEIAKLKADLHIAQVDINYAIYFPFMERYVSLFPASSKTTKTDDDEQAAAMAALALHAERPPVWREIEEAMEEGPRALLRLQGRQPAVDSARLKSTQTETASKRRYEANESKRTRPTGSAAPAAADGRAHKAQNDPIAGSKRAAKGQPKKEAADGLSNGSDREDDGDDREDFFNYT